MEKAGCIQRRWKKVRNDYAVRNIDKLEAAIKPAIWKKRWSCTKLNVEKKTGFAISQSAG